MEQYTEEWRQLQDVLRTATQADLVRQYGSLMTRLNSVFPTIELKMDVKCSFPPLPGKVLINANYYTKSNPV